VIDIMEALKRSLAEKRKPVAAAAASVGASLSGGEEPAQEAPRKRVRKTAAGS
jgi:hypothetical protein